MEILAGAGTEQDEQRLKQMLSVGDLLPIQGLADHQDAAGIYRACRRRGLTIRSINDCLIATVAIREDVELLTADLGDFTAIASCTSLRLVAV